jgi:hypothetical protein
MDPEGVGDEAPADAPPPPAAPAEAGELDAGVATPGRIADPKLGAEYDPAKAREYVRIGLAVALVALLGAVVLMPVIAVTMWHQTWDDLEGLVSTSYPAVLGIAGTALGFYFGSERRP